MHFSVCPPRRRGTGDLRHAPRLHPRSYQAAGDTH